MYTFVSIVRLKVRETVDKKTIIHMHVYRTNNNNNCWLVSEVTYLLVSQ